VIDFSKSSIRGSVTLPAAIQGSSDMSSDITGFPKDDRSVIEVFATGIQSVTHVVYSELGTRTVCSFIDLWTDG